MVLIGGQAVAFWAHYYAITDLPLTSKDIDFCGNKRAAELCAERLGGSPSFPGMDDATPNSAVVRFVDDDGVERILDFLDAPFGLSAEEVHRLSQVFSILDPAGQDTGSQFRVMHPLHCLVSRINNTAALPGYSSPHALRQLRFSVDVLGAFISQVLDEGETRPALTLIEAVYRLCLERAALEVFARHQVDAFAIVPVGGRGLPAKYERLRYPQMAAALRRRRERWMRTCAPGVGPPTDT